MSDLACFALVGVILRGPGEHDCAFLWARCILPPKWSAVHLLGVLRFSGHWRWTSFAGVKRSRQRRSWLACLPFGCGRHIGAKKIHDDRFDCSQFLIIRTLHTLLNSLADFHHDHDSPTSWAMTSTLSPSYRHQRCNLLTHNHNELKTFDKETFNMTTIHRPVEQWLRRCHHLNGTKVVISSRKIIIN